MTSLVPAYGRDYKSKKEVIVAWEAKKDFCISSLFDPDCGRYFSIDSAKDAGIKEVSIRFKKLTQVCVIKVK